MWNQDFHLSDQDLLRDLDGELPAGEVKRAHEHLDACWKCRTRRQEMEGAIERFMQCREAEPDDLPPAAGPRALLKAQLAELSHARSNPPAPWFSHKALTWAAAVTACGFVALALYVVNSDEPFESARAKPVVVSVPDSRLTPGATLLASRREVCSESNTKNKAVPVALQRRVFAEYGIKGADPRAYEVDYLITPALGGADDIHNLWPHSYSSAVWNAQVKDALEDRLRNMVCEGNLDLQEAQQEIARDWIAAYKKYFNTDRPLAQH
jgi:hypothetical protein